MDHDGTQQWLDALGYSAHSGALHAAGDPVPDEHPYAPELRALLDPKRAIQATAVFDVEGMPTVCFLDARGRQQDWIEEVRQRIWNQNLVSILLFIDGDCVVARSPLVDTADEETLALTQARRVGKLSADDIQSGQIWSRKPSWFDRSKRVDSDLIENLGVTVDKLVMEHGLERSTAQLLMGQIMFVSYLEHRGIVGDYYRRQHGIESLHALVRARSRRGLVRLFRELSDSFNGDFLAPAVAARAGWSSLSEEAFDLLDRFLSRVTIETGQQSFWNYDFRFIPVELLSGIYETFLGEQQEQLGAYYTPRHLANLLVALAFKDIGDPTQERVFDGACGSGILLTTAFRRMLGHAQAKRGGEVLSFKERCDLLTRHIFGSDLSEPACRVTAFSLYLSLLEDLVPSDIDLLTKDPDTKLPPLLGKTIFHGTREGDFFSQRNPLAVPGKCTIILSNPPWREPGREETELSYEKWLKANHRATARRQIAGAYAQRAVSLLPPNGRVALILPISLIAAPTSQKFVRNWFLFARPEQVVNLGDLRRQLFPNAKHGCAIVVAQPRSGEALGKVPPQEFFEYWAPKVDVSLAFGRLSLYTGDRHSISTQDWWRDNQVLRIHTWGNREDHKLITRLQLLGSIETLVEHGQWTLVKGFHLVDKARAAVSPARLRKFRYLAARNIPPDAPTLSATLLEPFPREITAVASYGSSDGRAFTGPRVIFPDGISQDLRLRAVYTDLDVTFKHSVTAICGTAEDEDVLRFLAVYLRSDLASYLVLHTAFSPANERERVTVDEVRELPFVHPDVHEDPKLASEIVKRVADATRRYEALDGVLSPPWHEPDCEVLISDYFGLSTIERDLVREAVEWAIPSRQTSDPARLLTPWQNAPSQATQDAYAETLREALIRWSQARGGRAHFDVNPITSSDDKKRGVGLVEIRLLPGVQEPSSPSYHRPPQAARALLNQLRRHKLLPVEVAEDTYVASDFIVIAGYKAYLVKPLVNRLWRQGRAMSDAQRIMEESTRA